MSRVKFDPREMTEVAGMYPALNTDMFAALGMPFIPAQPRYYRPITPKENWKLLFEREKPYWIPQAGWILCDINVFRPRLHPDNVATHIIFDGELPYEYPGDIMRSSWFQLDWQYVACAGGATVLPGKPKVMDITKWEDYISIPDLDELDWDGCAQNNKEYLNIDKLNQLGILSGFWERLMSLMDVENAAVALIDEEQQEGVHRFFDEYANLLIEYIKRMNACCDIDNVLIHDDWGHQNGPFFSLEAGREMLVPYLKRVIDCCHELGLTFELHSCGKNEMLVPAYIEAGVDLWCGQDINDFDLLLQKYSDSSIAFGIPAPIIGRDVPEEDIRKLAYDWVQKYKDYRIAGNFRDTPPAFVSAVYEYSRKEFQESDL